MSSHFTHFSSLKPSGAAHGLWNCKLFSLTHRAPWHVSCWTLASAILSLPPRPESRPFCLFPGQLPEGLLVSCPHAHAEEGSSLPCAHSTRPLLRHPLLPARPITRLVPWQRWFQEEAWRWGGWGVQGRMSFV